jgi:hypothetical protein
MRLTAPYGIRISGGMGNLALCLPIAIGFSACVVLYPLMATVGMALLLVGALVLVAARSVQLTIFMLALASGMNGIRINLGVVTLLPEHLPLALLVIHIIRHRGGGGKSVPLAGAWLGLVLWLGTAIAASVLHAPETAQSFRLILWTAVSTGTLWLLYKLETPISAAITPVVMGATMAALAGLLGFIVANAANHLNLAVEPDYGSDTFRARGLMLEPNLLASYCLAVLCAAYVANRYVPALVGRVAYPVLCLTILATYTRSAAICLGLLGLLIILTNKHRSMILTAIAVLGAVGLVIVLLRGSATQGSPTPVVEALGQRVHSLFAISTGTGRSRTSSVSIALSELAESRNWLEGLGYNTFPQRHTNALASNGQYYLGVFPVALIYDSGILGLIGFLAAYMTLWARAIRLLGWRVHPLFVSLAWVSLTTNEFWFAYPWMAIALLICPAPATKSTASSDIPRNIMVGN